MEGETSGLEVPGRRIADESGRHYRLPQTFCLQHCFAAEAGKISGGGLKVDTPSPERKSPGNKTDATRPNFPPF